MPGVFLVRADNTLVSMTQSDYLNEADLQHLIAAHPALLSSCTAATEGGECDLLLVKREMGVPDQDKGSDRWSLDHFYIDQNCVPVMVEVKRSTSGDMRRAIVGQLLDYAANGAVYWSVEGIKQALQQQWGGPESAQEKLDAFLESANLQENDFWQRVEKNLEDHNIRLVFVADKLPRELCRVIEFLNGQMKDVEVLGIELRQFRESDQANALRAIAPSVIGRTSEAEITKRQVHGAKRTFEALDRVVDEYRRLAKDTPAVEHGELNYRQIYLGSNVRRAYHYEFLSQVRRGLTCEFHAEVNPPRPELDEALKALAGSVRMIAHIEQEYIQRGRTPGLRIRPTEQDDPAAIAQAMIALIQTTRDPIEKAIESGQ